ncbi:MAG: CcoQ/FixQ family Cbb3-type cytochrome c oxidase assembly chaperone [Desulfuromonadales bacterium]|nr:MAG: CcoQ/FixQ family Cbb3-type cytochrome c oxidase assembly chaperone [Desulfuromonadales bacterium]
MDAASLYYLGVTFLLFAVFAAICVRVLARKRRDRGEAPKYRMMDED